MYLLTLKRLALHFTNLLVNIVLKFYEVSFFKRRNPESAGVLSLYHLQIQSAQLRRAKESSLGNHMVYPRLSHPSYELERMISHSNLTIYKQWNEEKYLESLQMNVSNSYCKKYKYHLHLELAQLI